MLVLQAPHNDGARCVFPDPIIGQGVCAAEKKNWKLGGIDNFGANRMPVILETQKYPNSE